MAPQREPIMSPSIAVSPMVVAKLLRPRIAHRLAPLPRWATMTRPSALAPATCGRTLAM